MNAKKYVEEMKGIYKNPKDWAVNQYLEVTSALDEGEIEEVNDEFLKELENCTLWEDVEDIANRYII